MASDQTVQTIFEVVDKTSKKVDEMSKSLKGYGKTTEGVNKKQKGFIDGLTNKIPIGAAAAGAAVAALVVGVSKAAIELGELGAQSEFVSKNFSKFAKSAGKESEGMLKSLRAASQGMISDLKLQQLAMQSMVSGVAFDDMITAMKFVSRQATATGANVSQKMQTVMTGFARGSAQFLDDVGIQVIGAEDVIGAAVEQMKDKMNLFADAAGTATGNIESTKSEIDNVKAAIGQDLMVVTESWNNLLLKSLSVVSKITNALTETRRLNDIQEALNKQAATNEDIVAIDRARSEINKKSLDNFIKAEIKLEQIRSGKQTAESISAAQKLNKQIMDMVGIRGQILKIELETGGSIKEGFKLREKIIAQEKAKAQLLTSTSKSKSKDKDAEAGALKIIRSQERALKKIQEESTKIAKQRYEAKKRSEQAAVDARNEQIEFTAFMREQGAIRLQEVLNGIKAREEAENRTKKNSIAMTWDAANQIVNTVNMISGARQQATDKQLNKELDAINSSRMSEKKKAEAREKAEAKAQAAIKKSANIAWAASSAMAAADALGAVISTIRYQIGGAITKTAAGIGIAAEVGSMVSGIAATKPRFYNGGEIPSNGRSGDSQLAMVRSGERVLTPAQNREWKVDQNKITNNNSRNITAYTTVNVNGGNPSEVQSAVEIGVAAAIEKADRSGSIDYSRMPNFQNAVRGL